MTSINYDGNGSWNFILKGSQQVFIDVESHELVDVEKKSPVATTPSTENVYAVQGRPFGEKRTSVTINVPPAVRHA